MSPIVAAVMPKPGARVELREFPEPDLELDSALLDVALSEVCGTDVHLRAGRLTGVPYPIIPGHVSVGRLAKVRGTLRDVEGVPLAEGDRVTFLDVHRTCHACWYCLVAKASTRCPERKVYGITYGIADGLTGGWAERLYLKPGTRCLRLGDTPFERFMAGGCALPTAVHAIERANVQLADTVLVLGSGPVGLAAAALARLRGAEQVLCLGAPAVRLEAARALGATTLAIEAHDAASRLAWIREHTHGRGADITIEATGSPDAVVQAMRFTRDAGTVVIAGQYTDHGDTLLNPHHDLNRKHLTVHACWGSDFSHFHRACRIMAHPELGRALAALPLQTFALRDVNEALDLVAQGQVIKALIEPRR